MDKLKQIKLLGEGAFGKCYLCENPIDKSQWVVKQVDISNMSPQEKKEAYHEAKVMSAFDHPNIIKFIDVYTTTNGKLNIEMNYADGGDLSSKIRGQRGKLFAESEILDLFVQVCLAIKHVHDRKVLHRDIKAQNIFLMKSGLIKLGDFGISKVLSNTIDKARTMVGTPYYLSPEIVENRPYSFKSDVWSLGVLLYELCTLKPPFDGTSIRHLGLNIVRGIYPPIPPHFSRDLKMLISQMLTVDSNRRPTVAQVLRMPFIKSKIQGLLSESVRFEEFSHTILHKQALFTPKGDVKKEIPRVEPKKEPQKLEAKEIRKEPPKPEVKEIRNAPREVLPSERNANALPKPKAFEPREQKRYEEECKDKEVINRFFEPKEPRKIYQPQEIPKFCEQKEVKKAAEPKIPEKEPPRPAKPVVKATPPPQAAQGRLEDFFKPVEKIAPKKIDVATAQAREDAKKKKENEAKKKLEELIQKRENSKQEAISRQEAADKKKSDKLKKIQEERAKMLNDIKKKKNLRNSSQPSVEWPSEIESLITEDKPRPAEKKQEKPKYDDQRKKMLEALRQKPKPGNKNNEIMIEWVGVNPAVQEQPRPTHISEDEHISSEEYEAEYSKYSEDSPYALNKIPDSYIGTPGSAPFEVKTPEQRRLYEILQEAIDEDTTEDEDIYITQVPEEELVDRVDEIADKEVIEVAREPVQAEEEIGSSYNSLESMRDFLEDKMGCKMLLEAYSVMKGMGDIDPLEVGYSIFYEKLGTIIPISNMEEYVSYLRTLIILENHADSYLDGILRGK